MAHFMRRATMDGTCPNLTSVKKVSSELSQGVKITGLFKSPGICHFVIFINDSLLNH